MRHYTRYALLNFLLVSTIGVILRYKIAFSLAFVDQKYLLHAHSHFAFAGWITHALMVLMVAYLANQANEKTWLKYRWVIHANLFCAYGMLISFPIQGYSFLSILFSTLAIFVSYTFAIMYWKDLNKLTTKTTTHLWLKASMIFSAISSLGAFSLAYMMATKNMHQNLYLSAVYFFLHFQYNGWFFFACMGLIMHKIFKGLPDKNLKLIFWCFAIACAPAYLLSTLWLPIPGWIYLLVVIAAFSQLAGWILFVKKVIENKNIIIPGMESIVKWLFILSSLAFSIKIILQLVSTIPSISTLTMGFRPIVIAYLHLILLGVISIFLLAYFISEGNIHINQKAKYGIIILTSGIIINEVFLMIQGIAAMNYIMIPAINEMLLGAAGIIFTGILFLNVSQKEEQSKK